MTGGNNNNNNSHYAGMSKPLSDDDPTMYSRRSSAGSSHADSSAVHTHYSHHRDETPSWVSGHSHNYYERSDDGHSHGDATSAGHYSHNDDDDDNLSHWHKNVAASSASSHDSKVVRRVRWLVAVVLFILTLGVAVLVYFVTRAAERDRFEDQFEQDAATLFRSLSETMDLTFGALDTLAHSMAAYALASNQSWPLVQVPFYNARAEKTRALTNAVTLAVFSHVQDHDGAPEHQGRAAWQNFTAARGRDMVAEAYEIQQRQGIFQDKLAQFGVEDPSRLWYWDVIYGFDEFTKDPAVQGTVGVEPRSAYLPQWHISPMVPVGPPYNWDLLSASFQGPITSVLTTHQAIITPPYNIPFPDDPERNAESADVANFFRRFLDDGVEALEPISDYYYPVVEDAPLWVSLPFADGEYRPQEHRVGAVLSAAIYWRDNFRDVLPEGHDGLVLVVESACSPAFTYELNGPATRYLGDGDRHESAYDHLGVSRSSSDLTRFELRGQVYTGVPINDRICPFTIRLYPSSRMEDDFVTHRPVLFSFLSIAVWIFAVVVFVVYDYVVERRNQRVVKKAAQTDAIVSQMLPVEIRDKLYQTMVVRAGPGANRGSNAVVAATTEHPQEGTHKELHHHHNQFDDDLDGGTTAMGGLFGVGGQYGPLAELYLNTTVIQVDIHGFTAWSSTREPGQVFDLLESIYRRWDRLAYRHNVMKIETVGDCYVAVSGIPEPRSDHVVAIARFARDVLHEFSALTRRLEVKLGPDTAELKVRIGFHSGQVTGGLLRGTMTRYQLFGDTVNTAARLLNTCKAKAIHLSSTSADLLRGLGKEKWLEKRSTPIDFKGKGSMETYWLLPRTKTTKQQAPPSVGSAPEMAPILEDADAAGVVERQHDDSSAGDSAFVDELDAYHAMDEIDRLVEWNTGVLGELLKQILAARDDSTADETAVIRSMEQQIGTTGTVLEEFQEIIELPTVTAKDLERRKNIHSVNLSHQTMEQLRHFVAAVASMYRNNAFHSFQHASHVTASVRKLLTRIVQVDKATAMGQTTELTDLSGHSYGITSDPLTQFAVVLSAVIHDCDHPGVPNSQLVKEKTKNATMYKEKSVAEQNSVDLCWKLLMSSGYEDLRACIYHNKTELLRFRQLVVNVVMATDIVDKELGALRKARWNTAFSEEHIDPTPELGMNRKATIVLEHLIQASDVSHTMQHWDVYIEWNERFFFELYSTYMSGRADKDPSVGWYEGEIGFFDFYIIPLAKKLDKCGVFGVSSDEYLDYAQANRDLWVEKGKDCVAGFLTKFNQKTDELFSSGDVA